MLLEGFQSAFCVNSTLRGLILPPYSALVRSYLEIWTQLWSSQSRKDLDPLQGKENIKVQSCLRSSLCLGELQTRLQWMTQKGLHSFRQREPQDSGILLFCQNKEKIPKLCVLFYLIFYIPAVLIFTFPNIPLSGIILKREFSFSY